MPRIQTLIGSTMKQSYLENVPAKTTGSSVGGLYDGSLVLAVAGFSTSGLIKGTQWDQIFESRLDSSMSDSV